MAPSMSPDLPTSAGVILQAINGFWAVMATAIVLLFLAYLYREWREGRLEFGWKVWWDAPIHIQLAFAIIVTHFGNAILRAVLWFWRYEYGHYTMNIPDGWLFAGVMTGAVIAVIGEVCIMRVVSRTWLGGWPWISAILAAAAFTVAFGFR